MIAETDPREGRHSIADSKSAQILVELSATVGESDRVDHVSRELDECFGAVNRAQLAEKSNVDAPTYRL